MDPKVSSAGVELFSGVRQDKKWQIRADSPCVDRLGNLLPVQGFEVLKRQATIQIRMENEATARFVIK